MTRLVVGVTLCAILLGSVSPAMAGDPYWNYSNRAAYPAPVYYPQPAPAAQERPLLKKLLIGGALVGIGFAAGRLTAPKPYQYDIGYPVHSGYRPPRYPVHSVHNHGHHGHHRF
jgi:hypothetical protein